jgi:hypothetical protein
MLTVVLGFGTPSQRLSKQSPRPEKKEERNMDKPRNRPRYYRHTLAFYTVT